MASIQFPKILESPNPVVLVTLVFAVALPIALVSWHRLLLPLLRLVRSGGESDVFRFVKSHEEKATRLSPVEEIRTLLDSRARGVLSLFSQKDEGYSSGLMADYACDVDGCPILAVRSLGVHIKDISVNPKCSLMVAKDPEDMTDLVVTLHGNVVTVAEKDKETVRATYLKKHPNSVEVVSGDFQFVRIEPTTVSYDSSAAAAILGSGEFSREEYAAAKPDPIAQFSKPVASHMNKDHEEDTKLIVHKSTFIPVDSAYMLDLDSLGFIVKASYQGNSFKLRIPFPRRAEDRKDVKMLIIEMLEAAKASVKVPS